MVKEKNNNDYGLDIEKDIDWSIFTPEEKTQLIECYKNGDLDSLAALPDVLITPDKELEIEKMVLDLREIDPDDESEVQAEVEKFWGEGGEMTPEQEAKFQNKIDKETAKKEEVIKNQKREVLRQIKERSGNNESTVPNAYTLTADDFKQHPEISELGFKIGDVIDKKRKMGPQSPKAKQEDK